MARPILDSRQVAHTVPEPTVTAALGPIDPRIRQLEEARATFHGFYHRTGMRLARCVAVGILMFGVAPGFGHSVAGRQHLAAVGATALFVGLYCGIIMYRTVGWVRPWDEIRARVVDCRLCFVCGYDLAGLEPESDGCTVCPECGGAWRMGSE